jgi:hypothetical protein
LNLYFSFLHISKNGQHFPTETELVVKIFQFFLRFLQRVDRMGEKEEVQKYYAPNTKVDVELSNGTHVSKFAR